MNNETRMKGLYHTLVETHGMSARDFLALYPDARHYVFEETAAPAGVQIYAKLVIDGNMTTRDFKAAFPAQYDEVLAWINQDYNAASDTDTTQEAHREPNTASALAEAQTRYANAEAENQRWIDYLKTFDD